MDNLPAAPEPRKRGRPLGSLDGPRGPDAPPRGHPAHQRSDEIARRVLAEAAFWTNMVIFAKDLGISVDTLRKYYAVELDDGLARKNAQVAARMFQAAMKGNAASMKAWLASRGGPEWSPRLKHEHTGRDGGPLEVIDVAKMVEGKSADEIESIIAAVDIFIAAGLAQRHGPDDPDGDEDNAAGGSG